MLDDKVLTVEFTETAGGAARTPKIRKNVISRPGKTLRVGGR
jgi:hypothetical protein